MIVALGVMAIENRVRVDAFACNSVLPNYNITSPTIAPPKFVVSAMDCCTACADFGPTCVASVFSNYYCYLKRSSVGSTDLVPAAGPTALIQAASTTTTTTTDEPTTTTAAPLTTTIAPIPPPVTTTAAPTPVGPTVIVRTVTCLYSSDCSRREDYSCYDHAYINASCVGSQRYTCSGGDILIDGFSSSKHCVADEDATSHEVEAANVCSMTSDETYVGQYCDVYPVPTSGLTLTRTVCPYGCDDGQECSVNRFVTGSCTNTNPFSSLQGVSLMAWCYSDRVVFIGYEEANCQGVAVDGRAEPSGSQCFLDQNQIHYQNLCRS